MSHSTQSDNLDDFPISETKVLYDRNKPPAITIVAWKTESEKGWKNNYLDGNFKKNCNSSLDFDAVVTCINENTFNLSEVLEKATSGDEAQTDITNATLWSEDLSNFDLGKAFSLNHSFEIGKDSRYLEIELKREMNYTIFIHDPHYFMYTNNPNTVSQIQVEIDDEVFLHHRHISPSP